MARMLDELSSWLEHTSVSETIQSISWIVPTVQTIHILAITVVAGSVLMINLRLIGVFAADQPLKDVSSRFLPFVWCSLLVLLATGAIMIIGEPPRSLKNPAFQLKMMLLVAALIVTGIFQLLLRRDPAFGDARSGRRGAAATIAVLSMLLWTGIIFAGRWIAYYS
jgi:tryptophan-rich sensory protein